MIGALAEVSDLGEFPISHVALALVVLGADHTIIVGLERCAICQLLLQSLDLGVILLNAACLALARFPTGAGGGSAVPDRANAGRVWLLPPATR